MRTKETSSVCRFLLEDVICIYGCVGKIVADRGELDANEARQFFSRVEIRFETLDHFVLGIDDGVE